MMRSRVTLATIDAAATLAATASPFLIDRLGHGNRATSGLVGTGDQRETLVAQAAFEPVQVLVRHHQWIHPAREGGQTMRLALPTTSSIGTYPSPSGGGNLESADSRRLSPITNR